LSIFSSNMPPWLTVPPGFSGRVTKWTSGVCGRFASTALPGVSDALARVAAVVAAVSGVRAAQAARSGGRVLSIAAQVALEEAAS
jgi:hypothetical protein